MYDLKIPYNSSSDCFDSIVSSVLKYYGLAHEAYNIKYFYTNYCCPSNNHIIRGTPKKDILKELYNINLISVDKNESLDLSKNIKDLLNNTPIGIFIDPYYLSWSPFYKKTHFSHCLLVVDIDYENQEYVCFDVYFDKVGYVKVNIETILKHYTSYFIFDLEKVKKVEMSLLFNIINDSLNSYDSNVTDKTSKFFNLFIANSKEVLSCDDLETSASLICLMWIAEDKKHFSTALRYIEREMKINIFSPLYPLLLSSNNLFSILRSMLVKYAMTGILKREKLKSIIEQIYIIDDLFVQQLKTIFKEVNIK